MLLLYSRPYIFAAAAPIQLPNFVIWTEDLSFLSLPPESCSTLPCLAQPCSTCSALACLKFSKKPALFVLLRQNNFALAAALAHHFNTIALAQLFWQSVQTCGLAGVRVDLTELEAVLTSHPGVQAAAARAWELPSHRGQPLFHLMF